jgi:uncharacterized protein YfbU (UPF0304 family)
MKIENLSVIERAILANQNRILACLIEENAEHYNHLADIAEHGYVGLYGDIFEHIFDEVSFEICNETFEILTMYCVIKNAVAKLSKEQLASIDLNKFKFEGFDANSDPHYSFMEFLIEKEDRYPELKDMYRNSHSGLTITKYRRLLEVYHARTADSKYELSFDDLKEMIQAI